MSIISLDMLDIDTKKSVFSACTIMVLILGITLIGKWVTIIMMLIFGAMAGYMAYHLFLKKFIKKGEVINVPVKLKE